MTQKKTRSRRRKVLDRVMLMAAGTLAALVIGEVVVRVGGFGPDIHPVHARLFQLSDDPLLRYTLVPNAEHDGAKINGLGFRGHDVSRRKKPGTFRIVCIGDSITFGCDVGQDETFPAQLERRLNGSFATAERRFEVLNFGVTGYNITQTAETLRRRAIEFDPDLIIYGYCLNDPQDFSQEFGALDNQLNNAKARFRDQVVSGARRLTLRSRLYALARYALDAATPDGQAVRDPKSDPQFENLRRGSHTEYYTRIHQEPLGRARLEDGVAAIGQIAREHDTPIFLALFPLFVEPQDYPLFGVHRQVLDLARKADFRVVDLTTAYTSLDDEDFRSMHDDPLHPSAAGHTVAAVAILRELLSAGLLGLSDEDASQLNSAPEPFGSVARRLESLAEDDAHVR
jgi:lysophospholipase L1-like esterase